MIISIHLPKTGGVSFRATLEETFGDALMKDYTDLPLNTPPYERNKAAIEASLQICQKDFQGIECIHGHFLPVKFLLLSQNMDMTFITWMRHPVDRLLSQYYFWQRKYHPKRSAMLHRKVVEEEWSLERFCLGPENRDFYTQYLWGFPLEYFSFIGITEFFEEDHQYFCQRYLGTTSEIKRLNVGPQGGNAYEIEPPLREEIEQYHAKDMDLYRRALSIRQSRLDL
jgi:hypothetical protein